MNLNYFKEKDFFNALNTLFNALNIPTNGGVEEPVTVKEILKDTYKDNDAFSLVRDVYFVGMVDDAAFNENESMSKDEIKSDYDGLLIFGVTLNQRENGDLLPTRSHLAEISRAFNREFYYTPVTLVFKYQDDQDDYLALANTERLIYKQEWREGEKAGKVSLLRDINISNAHSGHQQILTNMSKESIDSFDSLYKHWQTVFSVSLLNKRFYAELSNWYFWAVKEVKFPSEPTMQSMFKATGKNDEKKLQELKQEHSAKNVIRLLTRLLFVWFIKEKKLVPDELFDLEYIKDNILEELSPIHEDGLFASANTNSHYYKAILQNLFFATLNQEMGKRSFRNDKQHMNVTNLMRYQGFFKNPKKYVDLVESIVPFMNGGLFDCLDKPHPTKKGAKGGDFIVYKDGFSDRNDIDVVVPDYLFFGVDEQVDLSSVIGISNKNTKQAAVKGLINIFNSYKFTISENTPIEEDVALDPELLGKVFENLLASYNPETKTTARKQSGSFYTPREIVNYMVDECLIVYLKNTVFKGLQDDELDKNLHDLLSFDSVNPFEDNLEIQKQIIKALDKSTILDPACGSGAFPMGVLQKMVHVLDKIDPNSAEWNQRQINKVQLAIESLEGLDDDKFREQGIKDLIEQIKDMEDAFENNELDYGRKLFLIENCIFGVDIQPIAIQISKLRFFISLIVDQKIDKNKENFGIRPLPNLETKFVAANTLISIKNPNSQLEPSDKREVIKLEKELKKVRHKLFSSKIPKRKRELRVEDKNLRGKISGLLEEGGMDSETARQLAAWDPYDQNTYSPFFDAEWMFDIKGGFDIVIGNPPYLGNKEIGSKKQKKFRGEYGFSDDMYNYFYHKGISLLCSKGVISYITPNTFLTLSTKRNLRQLFIKNTLNELFLVGYVFNEAYVDTVISIIEKTRNIEYRFKYKVASTHFNLPVRFEGSISAYEKSPNNIFYPPSEVNTIINSKLEKQLDLLYSEFWELIKNNKKIEKNKHKIIKHRDSLNAGDLTLLGLVTVGAQGLVTGNNSKYIATVCDNNEQESLISKRLFEKIKDYKDSADLNAVDKNRLYQQAELIKVETGNPSYFGKFFNYKTVSRNEIVDFNSLSQNERNNGSNNENCWVYYARGNSEGLQWKVPYVEAINWTKEYVKELKDGVVTNSRWQGSEYYSETGFGWVDYFTNQIKSFYVPIGPYSKNVVKFTSKVFMSDIFFTALLNSKFISFYVKNFITNTHTLQINDGKIIPVVVPSKAMHKLINTVANLIIYKNMNFLEDVINALILELYFSEYMKKLQIDIAYYVKKDLDLLIMQDVDFNGLAEKQKDQILQKIQYYWESPKSEILKRINSFSEKSPDILKPILEG